VRGSDETVLYSGKATNEHTLDDHKIKNNIIDTEEKEVKKRPALLLLINNPANN
jgi:hypothetical protein